VTASRTSHFSPLWWLVIGAALLGLLLPSGGALAQAKKRGKAKATSAHKARKTGSKRKPQGKRDRPKHAPKKENPHVKVFDFTGLDLAGRLRTPQLIYFLDRAAQELELASLEKRSFVPEMVKSVDEESL